MAKRRAGGESEAAASGVAPAAAGPRPLRISGVVVRKADLIDALRAYVPGLTDLQATEDGEHFWLLLGDGGNDDTPAQ